MVGMLCDIGNYRNKNQDYADFYEESNRKICVIADGMGGHRGGEVASKLAVEITIGHIKDSKDNDNIKTTIKEAIKKANYEIYKLSCEKDDLKGMGTTITACYMKNNEAIIANVGDSSGIIITDNEIKKITKDHSLVQELLETGNISEEEARRHPNKNIITRALGTNEDVEVDIFSVNAENVDKYILCTDGLSNNVELEDILTVVNRYDQDESCRILVDMSKKNGSKDNISIMVFEGVCYDDRYNTKQQI